LEASNSAFSDPCFGQEKTLSVTAYCVDIPKLIIDEPYDIRGVADEGTTLNLACPSGKQIGPIIFVSFGTSASFDNFDKESWCHSSSSYDVVHTACTGKASCSVEVNSGAFGDPCSGVAKHLTVTANCIDDNIVGGRVAQDGVLSLSCPVGLVIGTIDFASYGTPSGDISTFQEGWCNAYSSIPVVSSECLHQQSCTINANNGAFGEPCVNTDKYLAIQARCVYEPSTPEPPSIVDSNSITGTAEQGSTLTLTCPGSDIISEIRFASYGLPKEFTATWCDAATTVGVVSQACLGLHECTVAANNGVFMYDPCTGISKHLTVVAQCTAPPQPPFIEEHYIIGGTMTEGSTLLLNCPDNKKIGSIKFASYGTPDGSLLDFNYGSCHAASSMSIAADLCLEKESCEIEALSSIFTDPCEGTFKSLSVEAFCVLSTDTLVGGLVQEDATLTLTCPGTQRISTVLFASFGQPTGELGAFSINPACHGDDSFGIVMTQCIGKATCELIADSQVFGDECVGQLKSLAVAAECADAP